MPLSKNREQWGLMYSCTVSGQSVMGVFVSSKAAVNPKAQTLTVS